MGVAQTREALGRSTETKALRSLAGCGAAAIEIRVTTLAAVWSTLARAELGVAAAGHCGTALAARAVAVEAIVWPAVAHCSGDHARTAGAVGGGATSAPIVATGRAQALLRGAHNGERQQPKQASESDPVSLHSGALYRTSAL